MLRDAFEQTVPCSLKDTVNSWKKRMLKHPVMFNCLLAAADNTEFPLHSVLI
jgi:hypothetical protein